MARTSTIAPPTISVHTIGTNATSVIVR
jgi:hypothetical protein